MNNKMEDQNEDTDEYAQHNRGIYLLPNLLTTATLFAGFYAIVAAMKGHFAHAAIAIFVATIADLLDGRVARLTNTMTPFGGEYDSLSDMAAFGVAPALVIYSWSLIYLGKIGWLAAFLFTAATALRLARFNTQLSDKSYFQGLPCPIAAALMACIVWLGADYNVDGQYVSVPLGILTILVAALMVSTVRYHSFKSVDFKDKVPFVAAVTIVFVLSAVAYQPAEVLFVLFSIYIVSGPVMTLIHLRKIKKQRRRL